MFTVTTKIPDNPNKALSELAHEINRSKGYLIQRAIESYIEEKSNILIALSRIEKGGATISLDTIKETHNLED